MKQQGQELLLQANPFVAVECRERDLSHLYYSQDQLMVKTIRGTKSHSRDRFFDEISAALQFPYYFGENWDAFNECINDLSWLPASRYVLVFLKANEILSDEDAKQKTKLLDILRKTATRWGFGENHDARNRAQGTKSLGGAKFSIVLQFEDFNQITDEFAQQLEERSIPRIKLPPLDQAV